MFFIVQIKQFVIRYKVEKILCKVEAYLKVISVSQSNWTQYVTSLELTRNKK